MNIYHSDGTVTEIKCDSEYLYYPMRIDPNSFTICGESVEHNEKTK